MINDPNWKKKPEERKQEIDFIMLMVDMINILLKFGFAPQWLVVSICHCYDWEGPWEPENRTFLSHPLLWGQLQLLSKATLGPSTCIPQGGQQLLQISKFGSCPHHQAIDVVHKKTLSYDLSHIMQFTLLMFDNDATGCFDQIIVAIVTIALRLAFPKAWMHAEALLGMQYYVKTTHGISENFYKVIWQ
jgi:hypothetical protein